MDDPVRCNLRRRPRDRSSALAARRAWQGRRDDCGRRDRSSSSSAHLASPLLWRPPTCRGDSLSTRSRGFELRARGAKAPTQRASAAIRNGARCPVRSITTSASAEAAPRLRCSVARTKGLAPCFPSRERAHPRPQGCALFLCAAERKSAGELAKLEWADVDRANSRFRIRAGKRQRRGGGWRFRTGSWRTCWKRARPTIGHLSGGCSPERRDRCSEWRCAEAVRRRG
jgi:hypothetical protein